MSDLVTWQFAPIGSPTPQVRYDCDRSNLLAAKYSSTEIWITLRKDF